MVLDSEQWVAIDNVEELKEAGLVISYYLSKK